MKKIGLLLVAIVLLTGAVAYADSVPQGVLPTLSLLDVHGKEVKHWVWTFEVDGATCVVVDGAVECFCSCGVCDEVYIPTPTEEPTVIPPTKPPITETPEPTKEPTPDPTEKPKCNRGLGNGSEDCDPGNSGGKPGAAGEDNE